ncbi:MAG: MATE family efflux transporter, partial [Pseudomonadota bacterium]
AVSLWQNGVNIVLDVWFVIGLNWGVAGVAAGTLIAEISAALFAFALAVYVLKRTGGVRAHWARGVLLNAEAVRKTIFVNRDIFIRTLCLVLAFAWFTNQGAVYGDVTLAANQVLLQFMLFAGFALDGPAMVAESLVGRAYGARERGAFDDAVRKTSVVAGGAALVFTAVYLIVGQDIVALLTASPEIRDEAGRYLLWAALAPLLLVWPFQLDGIFIGAVQARAMRNTMLISFALYLAAWALLANLGNHGLWVAFWTFFAARALTMVVLMPRIAASASDVGR